MFLIRLPLRACQVVSADQPSIEEQGRKPGAAERRGDDAEILHVHASNLQPVIRGIPHLADFVTRKSTVRAASGAPVRSGVAGCKRKAPATPRARAARETLD